MGVEVFLHCGRTAIERLRKGCHFLLRSCDTPYADALRTFWGFLSQRQIRAQSPGAVPLSTTDCAVLSQRHITGASPKRYGQSQSQLPSTSKTTQGVRCVAVPDTHSLPFYPPLSRLPVPLLFPQAYPLGMIVRVAVRMEVATAKAVSKSNRAFSTSEPLRGPILQSNRRHSTSPGLPQTAAPAVLLLLWP